MEKKIALYAGSFDPFTYGHLEVVKQAIQKYDEVIINVGQNDDKQHYFSAEERYNMVKDFLSDYFDQVKVICKNNMTVDVAIELGANVLVRGIRPASNDLQREARLALLNEQLALIRGYELTTEFIYVTHTFCESISSSIVKSLWRQKEYILLAAMVPENVFNMMFREDVWAYIDKIFTYFDDKNIVKKLLQGAYNHRGYHNWKHIGDMLNMLAVYCQQTQGEFCPEKYYDLILAILWHDVVTTADNGSAEEESVKMMFHTIKEWDDTVVESVKRDDVRDMILATKCNVIAQTDKQKLIADLDKAVLGTNFMPMWIRYSEGVRDEYLNYSDKEYLQGRIDFLQSLKEKDRIYQTEWFYKNFEHQAKINISIAICRLNAELQNL